MNTTAAGQIAKALLYEGYMLYPYRPSAVKNQQRFNFGVVYPHFYSDAQKRSEPWTMRVECLAEGSTHSELEVRVRFLQLVERSVEELSGQRYRLVQSLTIDGKSFSSWQEAVEQELRIPAADLGKLVRYPLQHPFQLPANSTEEPLHDSRGECRGRIVRTRHALDGSVYVAAHPVAENAYKIVVRIKNVTPANSAAQITRESALLRSLVSAHVVMGLEQGEFVSLLDPPDSLRSSIETCNNQGAFPVLVGEAGQRDTMLASPIILYDYPQIAPESAGDLFDGTEIDEILSLRILTMTDEEKREMRESDERARQMLERTENMPAEQFMKLHGALRGLRPVPEETR